MATANSTCSIPHCGKAGTASRGWCWSHYNKWRRHGEPCWEFTQANCSVDTCNAPSRVSGMCDTHYRRVKSHGNPHYTTRLPQGDTCLHSKCDLPRANGGLCSSHYYRKWTEQGAGRALLAASQNRRRARLHHAAIVDPKLSWRTLWEMGHRVCYLCNITLDDTDYTYRPDRAGRPHKYIGRTHPTLDHIVALAAGGSHSSSNVALACKPCNSRKHTKSHEEAKQR